MTSHDLIVVGAGPGGYTGAIRAAQLGLDVACVDKHRLLGGTCLRVGCIPSKALLESSELYEKVGRGLAAHGIEASGVALDLGRMLARKDRVVNTLTRGIAGLLRKNGVTRYQGSARFESASRLSVAGADGTRQIEATRIIIATGSRPASLPGIDLRARGVDTSTEALSYAEAPGHLAVIGAGYIGLELGSVWRRLGSRVTVLEYLDRILPGMDREVAEAAQKAFSRQGVEFRLGSRVTGVRSGPLGCTVEADGQPPLECDRVLVAVGRRANTAGLGLEGVGIDVDERGRISVDNAFRTSVEGVYAIGDVIRGPMLAHKAEEEGVACVERIVTGYGHVNYDAIPGVVYTHPEIAAVGKTEEALTEAGTGYSKGVFPFVANGRARALGDTGGFVKVLCHEDSDRVLGVHIIGPRAGDLIAEAAVAMEFGASAEDIARACHAHPTLAETLKEAALATAGRALHI